MTALLAQQGFESPASEIKIGAQVQRQAIVYDRLVEMPLPFQSRCEIVLRRGIFRLQADGLLKVLKRSNYLSARTQGDGQIVVRKGEVRIQTKRLQIVTCRLLMFSHSSQCGTQVHMGASIIRRIFDRPSIVLDRLFRVA